MVLALYLFRVWHLIRFFIWRGIVMLGKGGEYSETPNVSCTATPWAYSRIVWMWRRQKKILTRKVFFISTFYRQFPFILIIIRFSILFFPRCFSWFENWNELFFLVTFLYHLYRNFIFSTFLMPATKKAASMFYKSTLPGDLFRLFKLLSFKNLRKGEETKNGNGVKGNWIRKNNLFLLLFARSGNADWTDFQVDFKRY